MELKQLRHFVAIVDHGTFSRAAEAVSISQPALTRSIQNLEVRLGVELISRSTRGLQVTPSGEQLYHRAKLILKEVAVAIDDIDVAQSRQIPFRIGMAPMFAANLLPKIIGEVALQHNNLEIEVISGLFEDLVKKLETGDLDIIFSNIPFVPVAENLVVEPLIDIEICYVVSQKHPLSKIDDIDFKQIASFPWAVVDEKSANDLYSYIFTSKGETQSPIRIKSNSLTVLKSIAQSPPWITLLPKHMVEEDIDLGQLTILKVTEKLSRKAGLIYRANTVDHPVQHAFIQTLKEACTSV